MLARKIHTSLALLMFAVTPVSYALAQGSPEVLAPETNMSRRVAAVESNTALPLRFSANDVPRTIEAESNAASNDQRTAKSKAPAPLTLPAGTVITTFLTSTLTSRHNQVGEHVTARIAHPVFDVGGEVVIPADAIVRGVISDIASKGDGRIVLTFYSVAFGGNVYPMQARVISLPTREQRRGNTAGDAAKVGVGGLLGGIAGHLIGGNKKGTIIGAVSGAAAGVGVAAATRKEDIVVDAGAPVLLMLTAPFVL